MKIKIYPPVSIYETGQRSNQEDFIFPPAGKATAENRLFVVCDGMGGHEHGEVASQTIATSLAKYFAEHAKETERLDDETFKAALEYACTKLDRFDDGSTQKMGTTLTFLFIHRGGILAAHIGDSRIYHVRPSERRLLYRSRDHSLVFDLFQTGELEYDEMKSFPQRNVITRAIQPGKDARVKADIVHITDLQRGDYFYLCSDGMLEEMEDDELVQILSSSQSDKVKVACLKKRTLANKDNHSAYLVRIAGVTPEAGDEQLVDDESTSRYNALQYLPHREQPSVVEVVEDASSVEVVAERPRRKSWLWVFGLLAVAAVLVGVFLFLKFLHIL